jgi:hypothetical protein
MSLILAMLTISACGPSQVEQDLTAENADLSERVATLEGQLDASRRNATP